MIISNYQVQNTLRAYGQQLAESSRLAKNKNPKSVATKDQITISPESKKKLMAEKISNQIINQFADGSELSDTQQAILNRLSQEYGYPLQVQSKGGQGLTFKVLDEKSDEESKDGESTDEGQSLSPEETEKLKKKLFEITQSIVYNNLS
jgi:hypothetical protein